MSMHQISMSLASMTTCTAMSILNMLKTSITITCQEKKDTKVAITLSRDVSAQILIEFFQKIMDKVKMRTWKSCLILGMVMFLHAQIRETRHYTNLWNCKVIQVPC